MQVCRCNKSPCFLSSTTLSQCRVGWRPTTPRTGSRWFIPLRPTAGGSRGWSGTVPVSAPPPSTRPAVPGRTAQQVAGRCITLTRFYLLNGSNIFTGCNFHTVEISDMIVVSSCKQVQNKKHIDASVKERQQTLLVPSEEICKRVLCNEHK